MPKIIFLDYDNTLYSHYTRSVPSSAKDALAELYRQGHLLIITTGRGPESLPEIRKSIPCPCDTVICLNGQLIYEGEEKVHESFISMPSLQNIFGKAQRLKLAYGGYYEHGEAVNKLDARVLRVWRDFKCPLPDVVTDMSGLPIHQGQLYLTENEAAEFKEELKDYVVNWSHKYLMNLISRQAGKAAGIKVLMKKHHMAKEDSYAIGDGFNDVDMLKAVAHGVAMGNASDELKAAAEFVTEHIDNDGIYKALKHYELL